MRRFLGVDGGGTKTAFTLIDADGVVLARTAQASASYLEHGIPEASKVIADGIAAITTASGISTQEIDYAFLGLPAYGEVHQDTSLLDALPAPLLGHDRYRCDNDMVAGWAGSLGGADGINVISGTGSMAYGRRNGIGARSGGWGDLVGDEGSGHWIGMQALNVFTRMSDGRLSPSGLHEEIRDAAGLDLDLDLIGRLTGPDTSRRSWVASFCPVVTNAAAHGDPSATRIIDAAAAHLSDLVCAVAGQLGFQKGERVRVSHSGGVFGAEVLREGFAKALAGRLSDVDLRPPAFDPAIGAAIFAATLAGHPLSATAYQRLAR